MEAVEEVRQKLVPAILSINLPEDCYRNCEFWAEAAEYADNQMIRRIAQLKVDQGTIQDFIQDRYDQTIQGLIRDLRHFNSVNVVALSLMMGLLFFRRAFNWQFWAFSALLTGYITWAAHGYVFQQNRTLGIRPVLPIYKVNSYR